jgi:nicotinamidase-related amidase
VVKTKHPAVLVVVDMQPRFSRPFKNVQKNVATLLEGAVDDGVPIVVLEFTGCGRTHTKLKKIIRNHPHKIKIKDKNDGSAEVEEACFEMGIEPSHYVICGVYFEACVRATVAGLRRKAPNATFSVVEDACSPTSRLSKKYYSKMKNTKLVKLYN